MKNSIIFWEKMTLKSVLSAVLSNSLFSDF